MDLHDPRIAAVLASLVLCSAGAHASDPRSGRILYETHCSTCHYEKLHDREKSAVNSLADLNREVARWAAQTGRRFTPAELQDVADYLNRAHYRLEPPAPSR